MQKQPQGKKELCRVLDISEIENYSFLSLSLEFKVSNFIICLHLICDP